MSEKLSRTQKIIRFFSSKAKFKKIEEASRLWGFTCVNCNERTSIWDIGGIRYKASGNPQTRIRCPKCREASLQTIDKIVKS